MNHRVRLQQVLRHARNAEKLGFSLLKEHNSVILRCILTKLCSKVYILLFNSCVKFTAKIWMHC